ncbi:MAG: sugar ABC transporter permease [Ruminococcaceae bacterium]|nr:sugar ABC transporter permease [Oscillospiraceae bacterium]
MSSNIIRKKHKKDKGKIMFILFAITIPIANWLLFYVYTNASSIGMAFTNASGALSIDNFKRFFDEFNLPSSDIRIALRNTLITFAIQFAMFIPQVLVSYFIYKKVVGHRFFRIVFFLPAVLFSVCTAMCFTKMVGVNGFIAQGVGQLLGLDNVPELLADSRFANYVVWANMIWLSFPGDLIIWGGTFARIPNDVLESGKIDGVTWWQEFTKIIVPLVWPTVALKLVLTICGVFGATGQVFLLTGGSYETVTLSVWMYKTLLSGSGNQFTSNVYNYLSAVGIIMTVIAVAISLVIKKITDKAFDDIEF